MIRDGRRREEAGELEPAVTVRRAHHGNLDALIAQSSDTSGSFSFDRGPPFELEAELAKEITEVMDSESMTGAIAASDHWIDEFYRWLEADGVLKPHVSAAATT